MILSCNSLVFYDLVAVEPQLWNSRSLMLVVDRTLVEIWNFHSVSAGNCRHGLLPVQLIKEGLLSH